ncbi:TolC family protein [Clostridium sp. BNL1100]|uniref:TolC family protein n=1 Tax=Clostridium sp. BNL1100 TaxID=755731 RepID=UPI00024A7FE3|nr:TolC family protein [Clostridium sp. BNL1100]AEY68099.1 hypothetical protein Clo1100_3991 [Clostridium sp. BNL1100]
MKKIINSIAAITIVISILITLSYTVGAVPLDKQITLGQAQEVALENNSVKLIDNQILNAQKRLDYAKRKAEITDESWNTDTQRAEVKKVKELIPAQKNDALAVIQLQKNEKISSLKLDITKAYFEYLFTVEKMQSEINAISRLNNKLKILKVRVAAGGELKSVVEETEVALKKAEQQKDLVERDLNSLTIDLNSLLGRPLSSKINLVKQDVPFYEVDKLNTNKILNDRVVKRSSILKALNDWNEAKIEYKIINFSSTQIIPDGLEEAEDKLLIAEYDYNKLLLDEENNVLTEYNELLNLRDDIDIKKMELNLNQKQMNAAKVQYNNGYIYIVTYNDSIQKYEDSVIAYKQAKLDYYLASEKFQK